MGVQEYLTYAEELDHSVALASRQDVMVEAQFCFSTCFHHIVTKVVPEHAAARKMLLRVWRNLVAAFERLLALCRPGHQEQERAMRQAAEAVQARHDEEVAGLRKRLNKAAQESQALRAQLEDAHTALRLAQDSDDDDDGAALAQAARESGMKATLDRFVPSEASATLQSLASDMKTQWHAGETVTTPEVTEEEEEDLANAQRDVRLVGSVRPGDAAASAEGDVRLGHAWAAVPCATCPHCRASVPLPLQRAATAGVDVSGETKAYGTELEPEDVEHALQRLDARERQRQIALAMSTLSMKARSEVLQDLMRMVLAAEAAPALTLLVDCMSSEAQFDSLREVLLVCLDDDERRRIGCEVIDSLDQEGAKAAFIRSAAAVGREGAAEAAVEALQESDDVCAGQAFLGCAKAVSKLLGLGREDAAPAVPPAPDVHVQPVRSRRNQETQTAGDDFPDGDPCAAAGAAAAGAATDDDPPPPIMLPWKKYVRKLELLGRAARMRKITLPSVAGIICDVYEKKLANDMVEDRECTPRSLLTTTVKHYFVQKYGLRRVAEEYIMGIVACIRRHAVASSRLRTFGVLTGVLQSKEFSPHLSDVVMEVLGQLYNVDQVRARLSYGEGSCWVPLNSALAALQHVFVAFDTAVLPPVTSTLRPPTRVYRVSAAGRKRMLAQVQKELAVTAYTVNEQLKQQFGDLMLVDADKLLGAVLQWYMREVQGLREVTESQFHTLSRAQTDATAGMLQFSKFCELMTLVAAPAQRRFLGQKAFMKMWEDANGTEEDAETISAGKFVATCVLHGVGSCFGHLYFVMRPSVAAAATPAM